MTVSTTAARAEYTGNGSTVAFAVVDTAGASAVIPVVDSSHLKVYVDGTLKTLDTHYTVSINDTTKAATVTFKTSPTDYTPASSTKILILRLVPYTQLQDYVNNDAFDAENVEAALDQLTQALQQIDDDAGSRSLRFSSTLASSEFNTDVDTAAQISGLKADRANKYLSFDGNGDITHTQNLTANYTETSIAAGHILRYSGSAWVNSDILALDDTKLYFGTDKDLAMFFDEASDDIFTFSSKSGTALELGLFSDNGEDNSDKWKIRVTDGGTMTWNSKISGSYVPLITFTPHATATQSSVTIAGDLTVNGTTTTIDTANLLVEDPLIVLSKNTSGGSPGNDCGLIIERGDLNNVALIWDESADEFAFLSNTSETGGTAGNINMGAYGPIRVSAVDVESASGQITAKTTGDHFPGLIFDRQGTSVGALVYDTAQDALEIYTDDFSGSPQVTVDNSGKILTGITSADTIRAGVPQVQVEGVGYANSSISAFSNSNDGNGAYLFLGKSRGTSVGSDTIINDGDFVGGVEFIAADGTDRASTTGGVYSVIDGTPGANDTPGSLRFYTTADGSNGATERVRISSSGNVGIGSTAPSSQLSIGESSGTPTFTIGRTGTNPIITAGGANTDLKIQSVGSGGGLHLNTNGSTRLTIQAGGDIGIGGQTANPGSNANDGFTLGYHGYFTQSRTGDTLQYLNRNTSDGIMVQFTKDHSVVGTISSNANSLPSDRNFKRDIEDITLGLNLINKLQPKQFLYKISDHDSPKMYGLIAQELESSLTECGIEKNSITLLQHKLIEEETESESESKPKPLQSEYNVDYLKLIPVLINAVKELSAKVTTLEGV